MNNKHTENLVILVESCLMSPLAPLEREKALTRIDLYLHDRVLPDAIQATAIAGVERRLGPGILQRTIGRARMGGFVAGALWALVITWLASGCSAIHEGTGGTGGGTSTTGEPEGPADGSSTTGEPEETTGEPEGPADGSSTTGEPEETTGEPEGPADGSSTTGDPEGPCAVVGEAPRDGWPCCAGYHQCQIAGEVILCCL